MSLARRLNRVEKQTIGFYAQNVNVITKLTEQHLLVNKRRDSALALSFSYNQTGTLHHALAKCLTQTADTVATDAESTVPQIRSTTLTITGQSRIVDRLVIS